MHRGSDYQVRVAAWLAVEILAEESVDDLLAGSVNDYYRFIQAKRTVSFSDKPDSEFTSVLDQAVRQLAGHDGDGIVRPWSRTLVPSTDRFMLVTSSQSGKNINVLLRNVLNRAASLAPGQPLADAAVTDGERRILRVSEVTVRARWQAAAGQAPSDSDVQSVLSLLSVQVLDVEDGEMAEREAIRTLSTSVIEDPAVAGTAWSSVMKATRKMVNDQSGLNVISLRQDLMADGITLRAVPSFRKDIERLREETSSTLGKLRDLSLITLDGTPIHIERAVVAVLQAGVDQDSFLLTGHPGAGKSGSLFNLAELLAKKGDVVCLAQIDWASLVFQAYVLCSGCSMTLSTCLQIGLGPNRDTY